MDLNVFCSVALGLSVLLIVLAVVMGARLHRAELKRRGIEGRRRVLTPFQLFLLCFFLAAVSVFFPIYYVDYLAAETGPLKVVKALLLAVQNVLRLITLNGEFNNVRDFLAAPGLNVVLGECYSIYTAVIFVAAPLLTAGFVLSFFRNASAMLRYSLRPCRELYVMSELNEQSLALTENILGEGKRGRLVIFADVFEKGDERDYERILAARRMGAICVKRDVTDLGLKYARRCTRTVYLIGVNEDENIGQALRLINRHRGTRYDSGELAFYVFSGTAESEALLDSVDNGNMRVRRINESRRLALTEMRTHPIFAGAVQEGQEKRIRIALVGLGGYGTELLKLICCLGQMPGYTVEVHVFDRVNVEGRLRAAAPELVAFSGKRIRGEAEYTIVFHDPVDIRDASLTEAFSTAAGYTGIYVALGEDELNIETAMRLRTALKRRDPQDTAPIYAVVYDPAKTEIMASGGLRSVEGAEYGITLIGSLQESCSRKNIEQREAEREAAVLHMHWATTEQEKEDARARFEHLEYYRRSSMVQAVYRELREELGYRRENEPEGRANNDLLRLYEHRRWSTYLRGEGYVLGEKKDRIAKTHPLLVPFDELPESEKQKDDF